VLIRKAAKGSLDAFNQLVLRYQDKAYYHAYALLGDAPSAEDVAQAVAVREALRALLLANNGAVVDSAAAATLDEAAGRALLSLRFLPDGSACQEPAAGGVDGALGRVLSIVAAAMAEGTWSRLKACRSEACRWAFYDHARNRSRTWCDMAVCGNRVKARTYRKRRRAGP